jgi:large subunit ribosomal protein L17
MRHKVVGRKLSRPTDQRLALLRSLVRELFLNGKVETTITRAKETKRMAEKILRRAKIDTLHSRRMVRRLVPDEDIIHSLFTEMAERFAEREGGFTQIIQKSFPRRGDGSPLAILKLVE